MTKQEYKDIIKVCGKDFGFYDIPTYIRKRDNIRQMTEKEEELEEWGEMHGAYQNEKGEWEI